MRFALIVICVIGMIISATNYLVDANGAMERCMEKHSLDTCISSLR